MKLPPLTAGHLIRRYQRFFAEVELDSGERVIAHCPNTGSMLGCQQPGTRVWLSASTNPKRKLAWTWELLETGGALVGIHTGRSNALVKASILAGHVSELNDYASTYAHMQSEVNYVAEGQKSRIDLFLAGTQPPGPQASTQGETPLALPNCYIEVKNVTLAEGHTARFPDAITQRGTRHLHALRHICASGQRAVLIFCVQRQGITQVEPADHIDPVYGQALRNAISAGVEVIALGADISLHTIELTLRLPLHLP